MHVYFDRPLSSMAENDKTRSHETGDLAFAVETEGRGYKGGNSSKKKIRHHPARRCVPFAPIFFFFLPLRDGRA